MVLSRSEMKELKHEIALLKGCPVPSCLARQETEAGHVLKSHGIVEPSMSVEDVIKYMEQLNRGEVQYSEETQLVLDHAIYFLQMI